MNNKEPFILLFKMNKLTWILSILLLGLILFLLVGYYRISSSNNYQSGFTNYTRFLTGTEYSVSWNINYSIYMPLENDKCSLQINGAGTGGNLWVVEFFVEYDRYWIKEYKHVSNIVISSWNIYSFDNDNARYSSNAWFLEIIRNSIFDKWWKVVWLVLWMIPDKHKWKITVYSIK